MVSTAPITPWPLPPDALDVIVVGGSFDPPHRAHVEIPELVRGRSNGAWLLYVPASISPLKGAEPSASAAARTEMLRLALVGHPYAAIWTDELDRARPADSSFTIDTLRRARTVAPRAALRLLIGADQALLFHRWKECREILALAEPIVLLREPCATREQFRKALGATGQWDAAEIDQWVEGFATQSPIMNTSATALRASLFARTPADRLADLNPRVAEYIGAHGLYCSA